MTVDSIISLLYSDTNITSNQIATSIAIDWVNIAYHDLVETIKNEVDPDFFYDVFNTDTVAGQNEYTLQTATSILVGMDKVSQIGVKWSTTQTDFSEVNYNDASNLQHVPEWYEDNQSTGNAFYFLRDNSIFLYPIPSVSVTNGLRVHAIVTPIDLAVGGSESTIKIDRQFHEGIAMGARRNVYARRSMPELETDAINKFNEFKERMVKSMRRKLSQPMNRRIPNLTATFN